MPTYAVTFKDGSKTRTTSIDTFSERDAVEAMLQEGRQVLKVAEVAPEPATTTTEKPRRPATSGMFAMGFILLFFAAALTLDGLFTGHLPEALVGCSLGISGWILIAAGAIGKEINRSLKR